MSKILSVCHEIMMNARSQSVSSAQTEETRSIEELFQQWNILLQKQDKNNLMWEQEKLSLMQAVEAKLRDALFKSKDEEPPVKAKSNSSWKRGLRNVIYYFLLGFGFVENASGSYLFGSYLFALIPNISHVALVVTSLLYVALECILFYGFEVAIIKDALGIPYHKTNLSVLLETYLTQLKTVIALNQLITSISALNIENEESEKYIEFIEAANKNLQTTYASMGVYRETWLKKSLKLFVLAFGALSSVAGSYFFVMTSLMAFSPALIGTPFGWAVIVLTILAGLGYYYAMGGTGMARLVNPDYDNFQALKQNIQLLNAHHTDDMKQISSIRKRFLSKKTLAETREEGTQTEATEAPPRPGMSFFAPPDLNRDAGEWGAGLSARSSI